MDKKRIEIIITSALVIIFILAWVSTIKKIRGKSRPKPAAVQSSVSSFSSKSAQGEPKQEAFVIKEERDLEWGRCPFCGKIYSGAGKKEIVDLKLTGILWDEKNPKAVINGRIVGIGKRIGGNIVVDIKQDKVVVNNGIQNFELRVGQ